MEFSKIALSWGLQPDASLAEHTCHVCFSSYVDQTLLAIHKCLEVVRLAGDIRAHESRQPLKCNACKRLFTSKELMVEHAEAGCEMMFRSPQKAKKLTETEWLVVVT
mmetsp:Transcript_921/g.2144  ORF Transcript_921/g.2144 Transcript_921/m.2144 type:complete len:107 (+) Transcript_921:1243-1563(+)